MVLDCNIVLLYDCRLYSVCEDMDVSNKAANHIELPGKPCFAFKKWKWGLMGIFIWKAALWPGLLCGSS